MSLPPPLAEFRRVRDAAEAACRKVVSLRLVCCANLADLHCISVLWCLDENGDYSWLIEIEEASPEAYELHSFIRDELAMQGIPATVKTAW